MSDKITIELTTEELNEIKRMYVNQMKNRRNALEVYNRNKTGPSVPSRNPKKSYVKLAFLENYGVSPDGIISRPPLIENK